MSKEVNGNNYKPKPTWDERKQNIKSKFTEFKNYLKDKWLNHKKQILINYLIFTILFIMLLAIDQITKAALFKWADFNNYKGDRTVIYEGAIIGVRSVEHYGVTVLPWENKATIIIIQILSIIMFLALLTVPFFTESKTIVVMMALLCAGSIGNMLDRFLWAGHVKDIFFCTFLEKWQGKEIGTFNFADVVLVGGCIGLLIYFVVSLIAEYVSEEKEKNNASLTTDTNQDNKNSDTDGLDEK
ncbi:signal peptidase II [Mycoplasma zalophidermidis]|uniref:Signal peptidase II n=1 Tax=Mycoplasma zalophidermidis TaxID=398174 RepID=A0ABS6DS18_9MOLU|nr:signal peptidase II [Mycoplasma zalophidermidis]MBU4689902.1 signal peptidase II [Mycoplasma zalophidermidis]MBU4693807.1 signal peptidase II [Mycoplasma zalophidermidis]MCR8966813.1 signal peptidase II [Mycoplasma zalophidermidis]